MHERLKVHLWRVAARALPTKGTMKARLHWIDSCCILYGKAVEDNLHLFNNCPVSAAFTFSSNWGFKMDNCMTTNIKRWIQTCVNPSPSILGKGMGKLFFSSLTASLCSSLWLLRNDFLFNGKDFIRAAKNFEMQVEDFLHYCHINDDLSISLDSLNL